MHRQLGSADKWEVQRPGSYIVTAWFGQRLSPELDLRNPFYFGTTSNSATLIIYPIDFSTVFSGFLPPVGNPPATNQVKAGSAVPVKFSLGGDFGPGIFADDYPTSSDTSCESTDVSELEEVVSTGASHLAYDPLTDQYNYVWKTDKEWSGTCRVLVLEFIDGTKKVTNFHFNK